MTIAVRAEPRAESERGASSDKAGGSFPEPQSHGEQTEEPIRMTGGRGKIHQENFLEQEKEAITRERAEAVTGARDHSQAVSATTVSQDKVKESSPVLQGRREVREGMLRMI